MVLCMFILAQVDLSHAVTATQDLDINQLAHLSGGNPMMLLALGAVAILGGKKVWDWLAKRQEQQHEQKMAEIEAAKVPVGTGHEQCVAKQEALESQVTAIKGKVGEINGKASEAQKKFDEVIGHANENFTALGEDVKKLKKKVKKIQEEIEEQEKARKKKKKVSDDE